MKLEDLLKLPLLAIVFGGGAIFIILVFGLIMYEIIQEGGLPMYFMFGVVSSVLMFIFGESIGSRRNRK
jgi:uncharacterized protein YacL